MSTQQEGPTDEQVNLWRNEYAADAPPDWSVRHYIARKAYEAGLERAAQACEQRNSEGDGPDSFDWHSKDYAKAIRALKEQP